jgi:hypothetical protein
MDSLQGLLMNALTMDTIANVGSHNLEVVIFRICVVYAHIQKWSTSIYVHKWKPTIFVYVLIRKWSASYMRIYESG